MKEGSRVKVCLDKEIEKAKSGKKKYRVCPGVLELWEAINGKTGAITRIVSDDEIWVVGDRTKKERMFNKESLILYKKKIKIMRRKRLKNLRKSG